MPALELPIMNSALFSKVKKYSNLSDGKILNFLFLSNLLILLIITSVPRSLLGNITINFLSTSSRHYKISIFFSNYFSCYRVVHHSEYVNQFHSIFTESIDELSGFIKSKSGDPIINIFYLPL